MLITIISHNLYNNEDFFLKKYPELFVEQRNSTKQLKSKKIHFEITHASVDSTGHLTNCKVIAHINYGNTTEELPNIATEMEKTLKSYYPWRVIYINGEYRAYGIERFHFIYTLLPTE